MSSRDRLNNLLERMWKELELLEELEKINPVFRRQQLKGK